MREPPRRSSTARRCGSPSATRSSASPTLDDDFLDALYVGPDHQGLGIGTALLDLAKARRPDGFGLWVFASNAPARGFYHRHGLVELEHTDGSGNEEHSPDVRMAWPGTDPIAFLRRQIDEVDDELALLLARRFALTATVQGYKQPAGPRGPRPRAGARDRRAQRMAAHAPGLGADAIGRIMRHRDRGVPGRLRVAAFALRQVAGDWPRCRWIRWPWSRREIACGNAPRQER